MKFTKILSLVGFALLLFLGIIGYRWYQYVTNTTSPYDEVGIGLNSRMPEPLNQWGCHKLKERFGNQLPPAGCQSSSPRLWR